MKVEYINPFIEASRNVIAETTGLNPVLGKIYIKDIPYMANSVVVMIGITGAIQGSVIISLKRTLACKIASAMMGGMLVPELDEIAKSAIAELCNMILGNTSNIFYKNNMDIDITPPTVLTGENMQFSIAKSVIVCVPLEFCDEERMEIAITYKEK
ncbi:chemotaxis protein CheX [Clostridium thailandense]|uniref:Chemotaxis protein CheX n=1 Tax=Clostridium thailandense TaxID=2794346 RepID=A0A949TWW2_9CLOT|nr:chemotaxis protein CheX [Clostridium thailandense]MBV7273361.1 chemotaxis protein CheX [Clostridium thailandense]